MKKILLLSLLFCWVAGGVNGQQTEKYAGEIIFSNGYSENDIVSDRIWKFLNILKEKLWSKYTKNLFISKVNQIKI